MEKKEHHVKEYNAECGTMRQEERRANAKDNGRIYSIRTKGTKGGKKKRGLHYETDEQNTPRSTRLFEGRCNRKCEIDFSERE